MPTVEEAAGSQSPLNAALKQGVEAISENQEITFTLYVRLVLPIDGSVFWVRKDLVSGTAVFNAQAYNTSVYNESPDIATMPPTLKVKGSLHYAADKNQDEVENYAINRVIFTAEAPVEPLNKMGPATLWIGSFKGLRFAFGTHAFLYQAAGLWHYSGNAVYPDMETQVVDRVEAFSQKKIVSNSLPFWLKMNGTTQKPWEPFGNLVPLYPSFLLPANILPPWGAIHIPPETTTAIAAAPTFARKTWSSVQLVKETVRVTLFGVRSDEAHDFSNFVQQFAQNTELFGIMNQPVIKDEKRTQSELSTIAQKKSIQFDVNYFQARANDIARQLILSAIPTYIFN